MWQPYLNLNSGYTKRHFTLEENDSIEDVIKTYTRFQKSMPETQIEKERKFNIEAKIYMAEKLTFRKS